MAKEQENTTRYIINGIISVMALLLMSVMGWIAVNTSHIPAIQTEIAAIKEQMHASLGSEQKELDDHEGRIRTLEASNLARGAPGR